MKMAEYMLEKVLMEVSDITQGVSGQKPFFLMLCEAGGTRKLSVMIGAFEAQSILVVMRGVKLERPLLPDVYLQTMRLYGMQLREVVIHKVLDGVYYSSLEIEQNGIVKLVDVRTSDAIALALRCNAPIYTIESLLAREHIFEDGHGAISIPVSSVDIEVLREALSRAIRDEKYELAAQLRDEIARREKNVGE